MQFELGRRGTIDGLQEVTAFHVAVASMNFCDDRAGFDVESDKEIDRAMAAAVVGMRLE
jgi:hypothetical protein